MTHRFDVTMQEADRVDALYGFQDLAAETQGGADAECAPGHTPPQVSQVTTLRDHVQDLLLQRPEQYLYFNNVILFL